jgi:outer membrane lipoprotein SlyB
MSKGFSVTAPARLAAAGLAVSLVADCAITPAEPQLYPNAHYTAVGEAQTKRDITYCEVLAREYVQNPDQVRNAARNTAIGGGAGGVLGAVGGAVGGDTGKGAVIGAAMGAAAGILGSLVQAGEPNPTYERFVDHCLSQYGYDPIGWSGS